MLLSVIVPCYNEEENVPIFYEEMMKNSAFLEQEKLELEIIYIDDGSKDNTAADVRKLDEKDEMVHFAILYTSDDPDERSSVDLRGRPLSTKKKTLRPAYLYCAHTPSSPPHT